MGTMAVAGVLIWSKLRLATNIPRSAYAVPEQAEPAGSHAVDQAVTDGADAPEQVLGPVRD